MTNAIVAMRANNGNVVTISPAVNSELTNCCWVELRDATMQRLYDVARFCHSYAEGWETLELILDDNE